MSSYLSSLLTNTTSRYASLRRTLLSNEEDGDTPDDSHISRVLRAYYTEKTRPYPPGCPPTPTTAAPKPRSPSAATQSAMPPPQAPQSLRAGRRAPQSGGGGGTVPASSLAPPAGARPLPSQRVGSYQSFQSGTGSARTSAVVDPSPPPSSGGGSTAQERLKARLWGARAGSPGPGGSGGGGNPYGRALEARDPSKSPSQVQGPPPQDHAARSPSPNRAMPASPQNEQAQRTPPHNQSNEMAFECPKRKGSLDRPIGS
ncbi:hypothetical protein Q7P37_010944 [Cladosporium fusiforme]